MIIRSVYMNGKDVSDRARKAESIWNGKWKKKNCATSVETKANKWPILGHDSLPSRRKSL